MIYLLVGDIQSGKSTALLNWVKQKPYVYGILSPVDNRKKRFFYNIKTKARFAMEALPNEKNVISIGRYHFYTSSFDQANAIIKKNVKEHLSGYIVIDELGKLELKNQGLHASAKELIKKTKQNPQLHAILVIRNSLIEAIKKHYDLSSPRELTTENLSQLKEM
ncbi:nucleoside-triphosphatase [uncultured Winogradskyella sp.]|uniref:nucleoside-triphosphatase n=1 Tax=uncultured Winogradskyella sp. TaxID=395353 RepID=UPI003515C5F6